MSTSALVAGKLWRAPEARTSSKTSKQFAVATVREQATWWRSRPRRSCRRSA